MNWPRCFLAILTVAFATAVGSAALPDSPYQRWQLIENTLYANATWSYERINFDPQPIDVAIIGSSRTQLGVSAPRVAKLLVANGLPLEVANLSVFEDGRNIQWAIANELFKAKRPKIIVMVIGATFHPWGHPGFKYVAPASAIALPPAPFLHNSLKDLAYLPYRQLLLFGASLDPGLFDLREKFDPEHYAAKPVDYTKTQTLADGRRIDMDRIMTTGELRAEKKEFYLEHRGSHLPKKLTEITDIDEQIYSGAIVKLAQQHGVPIIFAYLPEFEGAAVIQGREFYDARGTILDLGSLSRNPSLYQSFPHLNHRGAMIASDRVAAAILQALPVKNDTASMGDTVQRSAFRQTGLATD